MNVYLVWSDNDGNLSGEANYYLIVAAKSRSQARYIYASWEGDFARDYFIGIPGFHIYCRLLEKDYPSEEAGVIWDYEQSRGVDMILSGALTPEWMINPTYVENYNRWDGFRKPTAAEMETER